MGNMKSETSGLWRCLVYDMELGQVFLRQMLERENVLMWLTLTEQQPKWVWQFNQAKLFVNTFDMSDDAKLHCHSEWLP